jgi:hypothetical protein
MCALSVTKQPATNAPSRRSGKHMFVKFKIKIQKDGKTIEKVLEMKKSSILYFIARLEEYGWKRI